jgi:putative membrane protein
MRILRIAAAIAVLSVAVTASAQQTWRSGDNWRHRAGLSEQDRNFIYEVSRDGYTEVRTGRLAENRATNGAIREFARRMIEDHRTADRELHNLAESKNMRLARSMGADGQALYNRLSNLSGAAFDNAYVRAMRREHRKAVAAFEAEANNARDRDLRHWVENTLPTLRDHLQMANNLPVYGGRAHREYYYDREYRP